MRSATGAAPLAGIRDGAYTISSAISPPESPRGHLSPPAMPVLPDTLSRQTTPTFGARRHRSAGFTLVELLVVILILGVLMAITVAIVTRIRDRKSTRLNSSHLV